MRPLSILVLGGTGFVGGHLCARLIEAGHRVLVLSRNRERARRLWVLPGLEIVNADVHDPNVLLAYAEKRDAIVNLVGILNQRSRRGESFRAAHTELARKVVNAARALEVPRLLHMSSLGAAREAPSEYLRTKGEAELLIRAEAKGIAWTIFRPSVIFGPDDQFVNRFGRLLALLPAVPLVQAEQRLSPVWVEDVVSAFAGVLERQDLGHETLELCGPEVYTLKAIVRYLAAVRGLNRWIFGLPAPLGVLQAALLEFFPGRPLSLDNYRSLSVPSVCQENGLGRLGIVPTSLKAMAPQYLKHRARSVSASVSL